LQQSIVLKSPPSGAAVLLAGAAKVLGLSDPGYEIDLLYLAGLLALCISGAGPLSLDGYLRARRKW
jgi:uncharacterized membrane protein YphA (DoxX/SURF4 family)